MEILKLIFVLGINFSVFAFIWGIFRLLVRLVVQPNARGNQTLDYTLRIVKYFLLVSVTAHYINTVQGASLDNNQGLTTLITGAIVLALYLLGKLQNRTVLQQLGQHPLFRQFANSVDPKVERFLLLGSVVYFVLCVMYPFMVDNKLVNWFTTTIQDIYETPIIGWIFKIIAFFILVNIIMRAANVIGRLLNGQSIMEPTVKTQFRYKETRYEEDSNSGFSDYEDVTEEEDKDKKE